MKTTLAAFVSLVLIFGSLLTSCKKSTENTPVPFLRIGLVGGPGGFNDAGFNQAIWTGCYNAGRDFYMNFQGRDGKTPEEVKSSLDYFVVNGYNIIITAGYDEAEATLRAASANPGISFVILDYAASNPPANMLCILFDVDQASFPCGFLAAWWAFTHDYIDPAVGFVGGPAIPEIRQFSVSYAKGVDYFNSLFHKNVRTLGYYASSFGDTLEGARLADSLHVNLANYGVGLAPFHDFDNRIPDSVKNEISHIKDGIINGTIKTGWPE